MSNLRPTEQWWFRSHEVCGVTEASYRPLSPELGEALMVAAEDLARLVEKEDWTANDRAQMRDLARNALDIINSIGARRAD